jgi:hypothetical protein
VCVLPVVWHSMEEISAGMELQLRSEETVCLFHDLGREGFDVYLVEFGCILEDEHTGDEVGVFH